MPAYASDVRMAENISVSDMACKRNRPFRPIFRTPGSEGQGDGRGA